VKLTLAHRRALQGLMFITPWLMGFALFIADPFIRSFQLTFHKVEMMDGFSLAWVGYANYVEAFTIDIDFVPQLLRVLRNMVVELPVIMVFALVVAYLTNQKIRGRTLFRAVFFLPVVIASGLVIQQFNSQGVGTIIDQSATSGMTGIDLTDLLYQYLPEFMATSVAQVINRLQLVLWRSGIQILLFLAGLQGISTTLYEAAKVDGATEWELFWKVTLPNLSPVILVNAIYTVVDSFTDALNPMLNLIRNRAFSGQFRLGYAAALGWVYFAVIFLIILLIWGTSKKWVFYGGERN